MKLLKPLAFICTIPLALVGCASSTVHSHQSYSAGKIARPGHIIVYDFAATPAEVPAESSLAGQSSNSGTPEQIEAGRKLGAQVAQQLTAEIGQMGLPAVTAASGAKPQTGDLVVRGYFVSVDEGSASKRVLVGFGSGAADLKTMVETYQVTPQGLRRLDSEEIDSGGSKKPGVLMGVATMAATGNPIGLIVGGASKLAGEKKGTDTAEGVAQQTAKTIAEELQKNFKEQGWI